MKLEVGGTYKTRSGKKVENLRWSKDGSLWATADGYPDQRWYTHHNELHYAGTYANCKAGTFEKHLDDIVSLWDEQKVPTSTVSAIDLLSSARSHMESRADTYDSPEGERSMAQTVAVFNQFHGTTLTEAQGWHFMQILKDVRLFTNKGYHADSAEDCVAYSALKAEAKAKEGSS